MAEEMITIDASALDSFDYAQYIYDYFAGLGTSAGASTYYGGTYTSGFGYYVGSQVGFRYSGTTNDAQVLIEGENIAYDGIYNAGHGISGSVDSFTLGYYDAATTYTQDDTAGTRSELTGVIQGLVVSGLDFSAEVGTGNTTENLVYQLYNALRKATDATLAATYIAQIYELISTKAQHFIGSDGNDNYVGTVYGDLIDGAAGADTMAGGTGDDVYIVDNAGDVVTELDGEGTDTVQTSLNHYQIGDYVENLTQTGTADLFGYGNELANTLTGNSGNSNLYGLAGTDTLIGGEGNDVLDGGTEADVMIGGTGNDTYTVDDADDVVTEAADEGTDTVKTALNHYQIGENVENLTLTGSDNLFGYGNELDNVIIGNSGQNRLYGFEGNDTLNGGTGADTLVGGVGNDTYVVDDAGDVVTELDGEGTDTVQASVTYTLGDYVENLTLTGSSAIDGTGNALDNVITGNSAVNVLSGGDGNDTLDGGAGDDTMTGGAGDDIYVVDSRNDIMVEDADGGTDTIRTAISHYQIRANIENLIQLGTDDLFTYGNDLDNTITGNSGNSYLIGMGGADTLIGGLGNDTYMIDSEDTIVELTGEGTDEVQVDFSGYVLGDFLENLVLLGSDDEEIADANLNATGNALSNVITGNDGNNKLFGMAGKDTLTGALGNDTLRGGDGADSISGGSGADKIYGDAGKDTLSGGGGADTFFFVKGDTAKTKGAADIITDFSGKQGDLINLHGFDANTRKGGNQDFDFIGKHAFTGEAGELRFEKTGGETYIYGDTNGDGKADFAIHLEGSINMKEDFFVL